MLAGVFLVSLLCSLGLDLLCWLGDDWLPASLSVHLACADHLDV